jgi:hypothetical protein
MAIEAWERAAGAAAKLFATMLLSLCLDGPVDLSISNPSTLV